MRTIRKRHWFIRRIAVGFAVAAFAAPVAQARIDAVPIVQAHTYQPGAPQIVKGPHDAMPPASMESGSVIPCVPACGHEELIAQSLVGAFADHFGSDAGSNPTLVASRFGRPNATTGGELEALNWQDVGIGAGLALALALLGGGAALATRRMGREQTA
jgi:hypothetical protein